MAPRQSRASQPMPRGAMHAADGSPGQNQSAPQNSCLVAGEDDDKASRLISEIQKFRLPTDPNQFTDSHRPVPQRGVAQRHQRWERDAVDAGGALTNGAHADGEVVWFRRPDAGVKSARRSADDGVKQAWSPG